MDYILPSLTNFLAIETCLKNQVNELSPQEIESLSSLSSCMFQEEHLITHKCSYSKNTYYGTNEELTLQLNLISMPYSGIQSFLNSLRIFEDFKPFSMIWPRYEFDCIDGSWTLASYFFTGRRIPLKKLIEELASGSSNERFPVECLLHIIIKAIDAAYSVFSHSKQIGPLLVEDVYLEIKESVFVENCLKVEAIFDIVSVDFLQKKIRRPEIYSEKLGFTEKMFFFSLGVIIYSCMTKTPPNIIPNFRDIDKEELDMLLKGLEFIPGLTTFAQSCFCGTIDFESAIKSPVFQTWTYLLIGFKKPEKIAANGFYTSLFFTNKSLIYKNIALLATSSDFIQEITKEFIKAEIHSRIIRILIETPELPNELLEYTLLLLLRVNLLSSSSIKRLCLPLIYRIIMLHIDLNNESIRKLVINTLVTLLNDNTLTIQMIFHNGGIIYELYDKYPNDCSALFSYISSLGTKSIEHIKFFRVFKKYPDSNKSIYYMQQIPIHFKLQMTYEILQEMDDLMKTWTPALIIDPKKIELLNLAIIIIYELLHAAHEAKISNQVGECYRNPLSYKVAPAMVKCITCNRQVCIICSHKHNNLKHKVYYLTHLEIVNFTCSETTKAEYQPHPSQKKLPGCEEVNLEDPELSEGTYTWRFNTIKAVKSDEFLYYSEIFITKCESEDILITLTGTGIEYNNNIPGILKDGELLFPGPRLGTTDTLGLGITSDLNIFFTYNGFNLGTYIQSTTSSFEILIKINSFIKPILSGSNPCLYNQSAYNFLDKTRLKDYECIANNFVVLVLLKNKVMKKNLTASKNLYSVIDDLKKIVNHNELIKFNKEKKGCSTQPGCKPF